MVGKSATGNQLHPPVKTGPNVTQPVSKSQATCPARVNQPQATSAKAGGYKNFMTAC